MRVVIKATRDHKGAHELQDEQKNRNILQKINFAYQVFLSPKELLFTKKNNFTISVHEFIEQESSFLEYPIKKQFLLALNAFKVQEGAHSTTYGHAKLIRKTFESFSADIYVRNFQNFQKKIIETEINKKLEIESILSSTQELLCRNRETIDQYCGFLTHTDFVPHNFRVRNGRIYLLDHSSIRFGNKYEGWARFINFMELYNPPLATAFMQYVHDNRAPEETVSLHLMRIYRLGELIYYYTNTLSKSSGDLFELNSARIEYWTSVLEAVYNKKQVDESITKTYIKKRDALRSNDEKKRQIDLH